MSKKVDVFFELLRAVYGNSRFESQWPDSTGLEAAKVTWGARIDRHTEGELKAALDNAQDMMIKGKKEYMWPDLGYILAGTSAKRHGIHALLLPEPDLTPEQREAKRLRAAEGIKKVKDALAGKSDSTAEDLW